MDIAFARRLIENPGEETTRQLFQLAGPGIFWVDWREADDDIVSMAAKALALGDLRASWTGGKLIIEYRGRHTEVPLQNKPGEQDITLDSLNRALHPEFEIRYVKASEGGDTLAFQGLPTASWQALEASYGPGVANAFARLDTKAPYFAREELPEGALDAVNRQIGPLHFARVALRVITADRARALLADPARAGAAAPVIDGVFGDLAMTYFHDLIGGDHAEVTEGELLRYATTREQMRSQAFDNVGDGWAQHAYYQREGLCKLASTGKFVASTVALWDGLWEELTRSEGPLLAAFLHRDLVLFAPVGKPEAVGALLEAAGGFESADGGGLSRQVYAWGPNGFRPHQPGEADRTFRKSFNWLQAERGNLRAQFDTAMMFEFMQLYPEAVKRYYKAAVQAATVPRTSDDMYENGSACQCNLADKYEHGLGVPQDFRKAQYWYQKSAAMGNQVAQYSLGMMHLEGRGVPKDVEQARTWLRQSAERGYGDAVTALASIRKT